MTAQSKIDSVLVVDDAPVNVQTLARALKDTYRIRVASGGLEALAIAESDDPPDIILLDIMMPEMDGYEVCRRLKQNLQTRGIPVIFITAKDGCEDEAFGLSIGAVDYISKPFSIPVVKARIQIHSQFKHHAAMLESLALVDTLTGVYNRNCFDQTLEKVWRRCRRNMSYLSLIMIDIDEFKPFNDNYGHVAGDECLRIVSKAIESCLRRPCDFVARYGGDEFIAIIPECDLTGVMTIANNIVQEVEKAFIPHAFSSTADHITVSIGHKTISCDSDSTSADLLQEADQSLYLAKKQGRNRVAR